MLKKMLMPLLLSAGLLAAQDASTAIGNWQLTTGAGGNIAVSYAGKPLISGIGIAAFTPGWKQQRFNLQNAAMSRDGNAFSWHKQDQHADAKLTLAFTDKTLRSTLNMLAQPTGPVEFGIYIPPGKHENRRRRGLLPRRWPVHQHQ